MIIASIHLYSSFQFQLFIKLYISVIILHMFMFCNVFYTLINFYALLTWLFEVFVKC